MRVFDNILESNKILVSDGAWGTFLHKKGLKPGECPELWNVTHRQEVLDIATSYINAGSDIILTNSFGGSPNKLKHYGLEERTYELNRAASEISREAAGDDNYVLGSIGPTGVILMMGEVSKETLYNGFIIQAEALINGGADAICIETMTDIDEALTAVKAVKKVADIDIACTFTFEKMNDGTFKTIMGSTIETVVKSIVDEGVTILGTNCGNGFENMITIVDEIKKYGKDIPVLVHANAGMPVLIDNETQFPETPDQMSDRVFDLIDAGACIIGGCCGTTPEHIKAIADKVKKYKAG
jgi:5-methyltetrahydrofolate--homocysteine methyltransferase